MSLSLLEPEVFEEFSIVRLPAVERARLLMKIAAGERDPNRLTNFVFFARHPELPQRPLVAGQERLMEEWRAILRDLVRPTLQAASKDAPRLVFGRGTKVLLVGDSHTYGPFGQQLERLVSATGASVVRSAKSGTAVKYWLPLLPALLREQRPDVVIVALGANMRGYPSAKATSAQIAQLVQLVRKQQPAARLVWIGPPRERADTAQKLARFNQIIRDGLDAHVRFVDSARHTPVYEGTDGVHYGARAAALWAQGVFAELKLPAPGPITQAPPVKPVSSPTPAPATSSGGGAPGRSADVALGALRHVRDGKTFRYEFTQEDLEWTARYLAGEAGADIERAAVLWAMLNRFAFKRKWKTLTQLLRAYSTPLQYPLNSVGAAYRHWKHCPGSTCRYVDLSAQFGFYPDYKGHKIPRGQLQPFIALQRTSWAKLPAAARRVAAAVLSGELPNVAGLVTEFADTAVYWRDHNPKQKGPSRQQWLAYTRGLAAQKKWLWPSDTAPYDQYGRNVLFVESKYRLEQPPVVEPSAAKAGELREEESAPYGDAEHARAAHAALEYFDELEVSEHELFDSPEHTLLGSPENLALGLAAPPGIQKLVDGWAQRGLIDGGAFIETGAYSYPWLDKPANPIKEWKIYLPSAAAGAAGAPYAGQSLSLRARWHWIAPDPVFRRPGERWTGQTLRAALLSGEALALNLGQIIMLAGDLVGSFAGLKQPSVSSAPTGYMKGYAAYDPYAWEVYSQLSPAPHRTAVAGTVSDDLGSLQALREPKGLQDSGKAFGMGNALYEQRRKELKGSAPPGWARELSRHVQLLRKVRGPTGFSELHVLAQTMSAKNALHGFQLAVQAPWLGAPERALLESTTHAPGGYSENFFQEVLTSGRYLELAAHNQEHFTPDNWSAFEREFRAVLTGLQAHVALRRSPHPIPADAIARMAYALHFLTDAFSSGHMRVPRRALGASAAAKVMHDVDGKLGLNVFNAFGSWRAFGDGQLVEPDALGKKILGTLARSGIDTAPDANLRAARAAVGAAFKQLHYQAQLYGRQAGSEPVRAVLRASRGAAGDRLLGDENAAGKPGDGTNVEAWIGLGIEQRLAYLRKHRPEPYPVGVNWDSRRENHPLLFDSGGNLAKSGFFWDAKRLRQLGNARVIMVRLPARGSNEVVMDATKLYQLALNTPAGLPWLPVDEKFLQIFDKLPEDAAGVALRAAFPSLAL
jgi:lysophospholipase L1-like esterase